MARINASNLSEFLVSPYKSPFTRNLSGEMHNFWIVLDEHPNEQSGYQVIFDEESKMFGLVIKASKEQTENTG